jgi:hypothetical protein
MIHYTSPGEFTSLRNTDFMVRLQELVFDSYNPLHQYYDALSLDEQWDLCLLYLLEQSDTDRHDLLVDALLCSDSFDEQRSDAVRGFWTMVLTNKSGYFNHMRYAVTENLSSTMNELIDLAIEEENNLATSQNIGRDIEREMPQACWSQDLGKSHD